MRVAIRTYEGEKRLYEIDSDLPRDEIRKIVESSVIIAKTILIECAKPKASAAEAEIAA